jgi:hypothetical protein
MLFPPFGVRASNPLGAVAPYHEVTGIFTTALPMRHHIDNWKARWGTGDIGVSDVCADSCLSEEPATGTPTALARPLPRCVHHRRDSNPLFPWREVSEIFTTSVG